VLVPFPFSDLSAAKVRPAVVLVGAGRGDWVLCQVTSNPYADVKAVRLTDESFESGSLKHESFAKPARLFTANQRLFASSVGKLRREHFEAVRDAVIQILRGQ
jgi:mRNA interferase MazF